jgi:hypothetical protein
VHIKKSPQSDENNRYENFMDSFYKLYAVWFLISEEHGNGQSMVSPEVAMVAIMALVLPAANYRFLRANSHRHVQTI